MLPFEALHGRQMMPLIAFHSSLSYGHCDTLDFAVLAVPQIVRVPCLWPHWWSYRWGVQTAPFKIVRVQFYIDYEEFKPRRYAQRCEPQRRQVYQNRAFILLHCVEHMVVVTSTGTDSTNGMFMFANMRTVPGYDDIWMCSIWRFLDAQGSLEDGKHRKMISAIDIVPYIPSSWIGGAAWVKYEDIESALFDFWYFLSFIVLICDLFPCDIPVYIAVFIISTI